MRCTPSLPGRVQTGGHQAVAVKGDRCTFELHMEEFWPAGRDKADGRTDSRCGSGRDTVHGGRRSHAPDFHSGLSCAFPSDLVTSLQGTALTLSAPKSRRVKGAGPRTRARGAKVWDGG